ncbi:MAG TPA: hypothetical protein VKD90_28355, partial [Gemmataceae bacterium]|nr:hypothetical protein [Gemmataceae bacterium]
GTLLTGLLVVGFIGKFTVGKWLDPGVSRSYMVDRQGRVLQYSWKQSVGPVPPVTDLAGDVPPDLQGKRVDRNAITEIEAPLTNLNFPKFRSYRNPGRFFVEYENDTQPAKELWWYAPEEGRLLGYDDIFHQFIGSFGPDGFVPASETPGDRFPGELIYPTRGWDVFPPPYLTFPGGVFTVDFARRTVRALYRPADGETVLWASRWKDPRQEEALAVVTTDRSVHVVTEAGAPVLSVPLSFDRDEFRLRSVGRLDGPPRFVMWYSPAWLDPESRRTRPSYMVEYDPAGREIARRTLPPLPSPEPSSGLALLGVATPVTEAGALIETNRYLRSEERATGERWVLYMFFEDWVSYMIPGAERGWAEKPGLIPAYVTLMLLSAAACALVCFVWARRYAFSRGRCAGWAVCGALFGVVGLVLMVCVQPWPARVRCPSCGRDRRVDRDHCEHCGAAHAPPATDGTEIFEPTAAAGPAVPNRVFQEATANGEGQP